MTRPPQFDRLYLKLVLPDLRRRAQRLASRIASHDLDYGQAEAALWREAWCRGAHRLANPDDLLDALACLLIEEAGKACEEQDQAPAEEAAP